MQLTHPQGSYQNLPPEDVFIALDDMGKQVGTGYIIPQYLPHRCPDRPVNLYFDIKSASSGWYILFGALLARARELRDTHPEQPARFYTRIDPRDESMKSRFTHAGMKCDIVESTVALRLREMPARIPMACQVMPVPLATLQEQQSFLGRLQNNDISHITLDYLQELMRLPHFHALGLIHNQQIAAEAIFAGQGIACELVAVYTDERYRRQGMAKALIDQGMQVLSKENVVSFSASFITMSEAQRALAVSLNARDLALQGVYPSLIL